MSTEVMQQKFHTVVNEVLSTEDRPETEQYKSVLGMVYTLVEDGRLNELSHTLKTSFPEYYH